MAHIVWSTPAFLRLETLPERTAFGMIKLIDMLARFPKMGTAIRHKSHLYELYRNLVFRKNYRILYRFDEVTDDIHVVMIQNCKQRLPSPREPNRIRPNGD